jgi:hypothetical protein
MTKLLTWRKRAKNSRASEFETVREHPYKKDGIRLLAIKKDWKVEMVGLLHWQNAKEWWRRVRALSRAKRQDASSSAACRAPAPYLFPIMIIGTAPSHFPQSVFSASAEGWGHSTFLLHLLRDNEIP